MTKEKLPQEYLEWISEEKRLSEKAYQKVSLHSSFVSRKSKPQVFSTQLSVFRIGVTRMIAAALVVIAIGLSLWFNRDKIFSPAPKYTEEQIALSFEHAVKALTAYSSSLNKGFDKLQSLPKTLKDDAR